MNESVLTVLYIRVLRLKKEERGYFQLGSFGPSSFGHLRGSSLAAQSCCKFQKLNIVIGGREGRSSKAMAILRQTGLGCLYYADYMLD